MLNSTKTVINRYLSEDVFKLIRYGFLAVHKRHGITCAEELEELKNAISRGQSVAEPCENKIHHLRAGHGGNLDNIATGVLAVGLCDGCKILPHLLSSDKTYRVTARLGIATDTYNYVGSVTNEAPFEHVTKEMIEEQLPEFIGEIFQKPPAYSALKIGGVRASDITRSGGKLDLTPRPVMCYDVRCELFDPPYFTLEVTCGKGFYVRTLVHELAEAVGSCGHITELMRTKHGPFTLQDCLHPENYSLENVVSAVAAAREKHPQLAEYLDEYWRQQLASKSKEQENTDHSLRQRNRYVKKGR